MAILRFFSVVAFIVFLFLILNVKAESRAPYNSFDGAINLGVLDQLRYIQGYRFKGARLDIFGNLREYRTWPL